MPGMTDTMTLDHRSTPAAPGAERPARRLRGVLVLDGIASGAAGLVGLVAAPRVTEDLGLPSTTWTRVVSALFVLWAVDLVLIATRSTAGLRAFAAAVVAGNVAYLGATAALLATSDLTTAGQVVAVVLAVAVLDLLLLQAWYRHRTLPVR